MVALGTPVPCAGVLGPILQSLKDGDVVVRQVSGQEAVIEITGECHGHQH
jgi:hypothetical protein